MKALVDRLEWVHLDLTKQVDVPTKLVIEEIRDSLAIAEVIGMDKLTERLTYVRNFLCGASGDHEEALQKCCEAMAIAAALPEIQIVMPHTGADRGFGGLE